MSDRPEVADLVRRVSGGLLLGAVLHGLWDFGILSAGVVGDAYRLVPIFTLVGAGLVLALLLGRRRIEPREAVAATPTGGTGECIQRSACTGRGGLAGDAPGPGAHLLPASRASRSRRVHGPDLTSTTMEPVDHLLELARRATGDDTLVAAGDFLPKGTTWKSGGFGGQTIGRGMGSVATPALAGSQPSPDDLATVGLVTGERRTLAEQLGNPVIVVAVSPERVYLLTTEGALHGARRAEELHHVVTLDRRDLKVVTKHRLSVRTLVVTERSTDRTFALEGKRLGRHGVASVLSALGEAP